MAQLLLPARLQNSGNRTFGKDRSHRPPVDKRQCGPYRIKTAQLKMALGQHAAQQRRICPTPAATAELVGALIMSIAFRYQLTGTGWSKCTLTVDDAHVTVTASYLSDALRDLISAVCRVLEGIDEATAVFYEEPGEFRWRLFRIDDELVRVMILEFDDLWSDKPASDGKPIFDVQCRLRTLAGAVFDGCKRLLAEHSHAGYKEKWHEHDFPDSELENLRRLLEDKQTRTKP